MLLNNKQPQIYLPRGPPESAVALALLVVYFPINYKF